MIIFDKHFFYFQRLVSIISTVVNLSEIDKELEGAVEFPHIGPRTNDFGKEIFKACDCKYWFLLSYSKVFNEDFEAW